MTVAIQRYMPAEILQTPGLFTAAMASNEENLFDQSFGNETAFLEPRPQEYHVQADSAHLFPDPSSDSFSPIYAFNKSSSQYPNPLYHQQMPSPPTSAKQGPLEWPYQDFQLTSNPNPQTSIHNISTQNHPITSQVQYGQVTPPDDEFTDEFGHDEPTSQMQQQTRQHYTQPQPSLQPQEPAQSSLSSKRKRTPSTGTVPAKPAKRSRKSTRSKATGANKDRRDQTNPEDEKRSKFLERNRVAASKCRQKKKEWTSNLESRARELQNNKNQLALMVGSLKDEMIFLRGEMLKHNGCECAGIREYLSKEAQNLAHDGPSSYKPFESAASPIGSAPNSREGSVSVASPLDANADLGEQSLEASNSVPAYFKTEDELEVLLTSQLAQVPHDNVIPR